jgi:tryptophanyl-tRNA synthetase
MTQRILSGITPSGNELHIGNYFGAVKDQIDLQNNQEYQTFYFIADLHGLTTIKDPKELNDNIYAIVADYLALGLDPEKTTFFRQSDVCQHSQLAIVLANYVSYGHMQRMHAFKDKLQKGTTVESINMGLFNYPILMAADILLYTPFGVPVGEDQRQHIEITRDIADSFNKTYQQEVFPLPEPLIHKERGKIIGTDGKRKMSKSLGNIISIFQEEAIIKDQIMNCYTDPNRIRATDPGKVEGNPIFIYHDLINQNLEEVADLKARYLNGTVGDVEVKQKLISAHQAYFAPMREKRVSLTKEPEKIESILQMGAQKATVVAKETLDRVYQTIGISK